MKTTNSGVLAALAAPGVRLVAFLQFVVTTGGVDGTIRYCTAAHDIVWNSQTWLGVGSIISFEPLRETGATEAIGVRVVLSGVASSLLSAVLQSHVVGRPATIWVGAYNEAGALISTPWKEFEGRADNLELQDDPRNTQVILTLESRLVTLMQSTGELWTDAEQKKRFPTDDGFKFVSVTAERTLQFGA